MWSNCPLSRAPARLLRLLRARLAALGSAALPGRGRPTGCQQLPRVLERLASKAADGTAFDHAGGFMCQMYIKNNRSGIGGGLGGRGNPEEEGTELLGCMPRGR